MIPITEPYFDDKEIEYLRECLVSKWVTQGPFTERFENEFKNIHPAKFVYAVSSCTAALHIALMALGIKSGDEVIAPAFTWITSASCVEYVGAKVRFVDVRKEDFNIDVNKIEESITSKTRAIIAVHLFGYPADMDEIMRIARLHGLYVVEDCACAIGTTYNGVPVGTIGDVGCFSFHPRKVITTGEGGICCTNDEEVGKKIQQYRNHGASADNSAVDFGKPYYMGVFDEVGYNYRMSDIQAAVGVAQFEKLRELLDDRQCTAEYYYRELKGNDKIALPEIREGFGHTFQSFVIRLKECNRIKRNKVMDYMLEKGIQSRPGTIAIHRTKFNKEKYSILEQTFANACICEDTSITLPIYPYMEDGTKKRVIQVLREAVDKI